METADKANPSRFKNNKTVFMDPAFTDYNCKYYVYWAQYIHN